MGLALGALAGILGGLGGLPKGMAEGTAADQRQQQLDEQRRVHDLQAQQFEQSKFADVPTTELPGDYRTQAGAAPTMRLPNALIPGIQARRQKEIEQENQVKQGASAAMAIRRLAGGDPHLTALADALENGAGANPQVTGMIESAYKAREAAKQREQGLQMVAPFYKALGIEMPTQPQPAPDMPASAPTSVIKTGGQGESPLPPVGQHPLLQGPGAQFGQSLDAMNEARRALPGVPQPQPTPAAPAGPGPTTPASGYQKPILTFDPMKGSFSISAHPTPDRPPTVAPEYLKAERALQELEDAGVAETDPRYVRAARHLDRLKPMAIQEGGGIGGPSGQPTIKSPLPARTPEVQIKDFSNIDLAQGQLNEMLRLAPTVQLPQIAGGLAPWVNSIIQTGRVGPIPIPPAIAGSLSDDQNRFLAMLQDYADQVLRLRSGAQINEQEFKRMLGFLASPDVTPQVIVQRLQLQQDFLKGKRSALEGALRGGGYRVPPAAVPSLEGGGAPSIQVPEVPPQPTPQQGWLQPLQRLLPGVFGSGGQGKVRVMSPDGTPGTWDLSRGPIPPGFKRVP
jgi:hypothetical protein